MSRLTAEEKRAAARACYEIDRIIDECIAAEDLAKKRRLQIEQLEREVQGMSETWTSPEATERLEKENKQLLEAAGYHMTTAMELRKEIEELKEELFHEHHDTWGSQEKLKEEIEELQMENEQLKDVVCKITQQRENWHDKANALHYRCELLKEENEASDAEATQAKEENEELTKRVHRLNHFMAGLRFEVERLS